MSPLNQGFMFSSQINITLNIKKIINKMNKKQDNKSTVEVQPPKDLFEYKKMKEAGLSQEFDKQARRESSLTQLNTGLRFVPYQYSRMEEYYPSALIDKAPSSYNIVKENLTHL